MEKTVLCNSPRLCFVINNRHISPISGNSNYSTHLLRNVFHPNSPQPRVSLRTRFEPFGTQIQTYSTNCSIFIPLQYHDIYIYIYIYIYTFFSFLSVPQVRSPRLSCVILHPVHSVILFFLRTCPVFTHPFFRRSMIHFL